MKTKLKSILFLCFGLVVPYFAHAKEIVNIYVWANVIPQTVIKQFEKETGIKVNLSTYDNNETLLAKLKASKKVLYDVIEPSSYFVERMVRGNLLEKLDKEKLPNWHHLDPTLMNQAYDLDNQYSMPLTWGVTGIFYNKKYHSAKDIQSWKDLWRPQHNNQLLLLDDLREIFSASLLALGHSANESNPKYIEEAFVNLKNLMPNVKLFGSDAIQSVMIDEDATLGVIWNGDVAKARKENANLEFIYPKEGFVIWIDCLAIPKNAPNLNNAYRFINFLMRPDIAKEIAISEGYTIANLSGQKLLPKEIAEDPLRYPSKEVLKRGQFQTDLPEEALSLYSKFWTLLKLT